MRQESGLQFDDLPEAAASVSGAKLVFLFGAALAALGLLWLPHMATPLLLGLFSLGFLLAMIRYLGAIVRHTRYSVAELWLLVLLTGGAGGLPLGLVRPDQAPGPASARLWGVAIVAGCALGTLVLRGGYAGLRLSLWLDLRGAVDRLGVLVLGIVAFPAHTLWKACLISALLIVHPVPDFRVAGTIGLLSAGPFYFISWMHKQFRARAQSQFEAEPGARGQAGELTPRGGGVSLFRLLGRWWGRLK